MLYSSRLSDTKLVTKIGNGIRRFGAKALFKVKKVSPEICLIGGVACIVGGTVLAVRAGIKIKDILDVANDQISSIKSDAEDAIVSEDAARESIREVKRQATFDIIKHGAPVVCAVGGGIVLVCAAKGIVDKRYGALLGAYNALEASYREYQNKMKPYEEQLLIDTKKQLVAAAQEAKNGQLLTQEEINAINKQAMDLVNGNAYRFWFRAETSTEWHPHGPSNLNTIMATEHWATNQLHIDGYLFLNDVLDHLGMPKVPHGQLVGWLRGSEDSDSYVELISDDYREILNMDDDACKMSILLDCNCDGLIWDKI